MAKIEYTKDTIVEFIKSLDNRAKTLDLVMIDNIINRGFAELTTVSPQHFSDEDVIELQPFFDAGEYNFTGDVDVDVTSIYDIYATEETETKTLSQEIAQGIGIYRNKNLIFIDNRYSGRFHVNLEDLDERDKLSNIVVKYYYTPTATTDSVFMSSQTYLAFQDAMWAALNYFMRDIEGETHKRASMTRTSRSVYRDPEDIPERGRNLFGGLGI